VVDDYLVYTSLATGIYYVKESFVKAEYALEACVDVYNK